MIPARAEASDVELVREAKSGDLEAFDALVIRYQERIYGLVHRAVGDGEDARELTQETFVKAFRNLLRFREEAAFSTWIYRIAINLATSKKRTYVKRRKLGGVSLDASVRTRSGEVHVEPEDSTQEPTEVYRRKEIQERIHRAIGELDEAHRKMVVLRDLEGLSYEEIAATLDLPIGTVRSRLHRARLELREKLKDLL